MKLFSHGLTAWVLSYHYLFLAPERIATKHYFRSCVHSVLLLLNFMTTQWVSYVLVFSFYRWRNRNSKKWLTLSGDKLRGWWSWDLGVQINLFCAISSISCNFLIFSDFECQVCFKKNSTLFVSLGCIFPKDVYLDIIYDSPKCKFGHFSMCGNIECAMYLNCKLKMMQK